jgi:phytoene dehydrogenase-like protein
MNHDAVVIGAGPNGLAAAITLARAGWSVLVREANQVAGGGCRSSALTLPGFVHDTCSAVHPFALASPFFRQLRLDSNLTWIHPPLPLAHPLDDGTAAVMERSLGETAARLRQDGPAYFRLMEPLVSRWEALFQEVLAPPHVPRHLLTLAAFGAHAVRPARQLLEARFKTPRAKALLAGVAAHSVLPLEYPFSAAFLLMLSVAGHSVGWPIAAGGSQSISDALVARLRQHGGEVETRAPVASIDEIERGRAVLCDLTPRQLLELAGHKLTRRYRKALGRFRYGPGAFKVDWALDSPIPWTAKECAQAGTVHLGGTLEEVAAWERAAWADGKGAPFVLLAQQSLFDHSRAPAGQHTAWAYCHVPHGSSVDMTRAIEEQVERFAPGFSGRILARHVTSPADFERRNPNMVGGDISGGANTALQLLFRPTFRTYRTSRRGLYLCSSSTPPGGGVHGMCGYHAGLAALADFR